MFKRGDIANNLFLICFTHMECILCGWGRIGYSDVSIHAPARGATKFQAGMFYASVVSIHAPTRGATIAYCTGTENVVVSIHAPTRGATSTPVLVPPAPQFQSTHPHGVRPVFKQHNPLEIPFQSTHPHGVRRKHKCFLAF